MNTVLFLSTEERFRFNEEITLRYIGFVDMLAETQSNLKYERIAGTLDDLVLPWDKNRNRFGFFLTLPAEDNLIVIDPIDNNSDEDLFLEGLLDGALEKDVRTRKETANNAYTKLINPQKPLEFKSKPKRAYYSYGVSRKIWMTNVKSQHKHDAYNRQAYRSRQTQSPRRHGSKNSGVSKGGGKGGGSSGDDGGGGDPDGEPDRGLFYLLFALYLLSLRNSLNGIYSPRFSSPISKHSTLLRRMRRRAIFALLVLICVASVLWYEEAHSYEALVAFIGSLIGFLTIE